MTERSTHRERAGPRNPDALKKIHGSFYHVTLLHSPGIQAHLCATEKY